MVERYGYSKEEPPLSSMEVGSMTEFLERLEQDDNERQHKEEKKLKVRKYLLVDRRKFNFLKCKCNKDGANEEQAI